MVDQRRQALFAFQPEVGFAAHAARLHDVGAARCPRQDRLRAKQVAHAHCAGQIGRQHQLAAFIHFFQRRAQLFDAGNALTPRKIEHRRIEIHAPALGVASVPGQADFSPARLAGMAQRAEGARQVLHETVDGARCRRPQQEAQRLRRPRHHGFGNVFGVARAEDESAAGVDIVFKQAARGRQPGIERLLTVPLNGRQNVQHLAVRTLAQRCDGLERLVDRTGIACHAGRSRGQAGKCALMISSMASDSSISSVSGLTIATWQAVTGSSPALIMLAA